MITLGPNSTSILETRWSSWSFFTEISNQLNMILLKS